MDLKIPLCLSWVSKSTISNVHDVTVFIPSFSEFSLFENKPVQWTLQRTLQRHICSGKDLYFDLDYKSSYNAIESKYPFYLWALANKINTNNSSKLTNKIYDLGEFALDEMVHQDDLCWISNLFPIEPNDRGQEKSDQKERITPISIPIKKLWRQVFEIIKYFTDCKIYWIEDRPNALKRAGFIEGEIDENVDESIFAEGHINIHLVKDENIPPKIKDVKTIEELYLEIDSLANQKCFNIFIVDMYFILKEKGLKIFGDNIIRRVREKESYGRMLKNLVIVFTHGSSPFVVSRSKALHADLIVFKRLMPMGGHHGEEVDPNFMLCWSIFWPLSIIRYICKLFQEIIDTEPGEKLKKLIERTNEEVGLLCPEGIFYFWREWIRNAKLTLSKWNVILASHEAHKANLDTLKQKLANLLNHAFFN